MHANAGVRLAAIAMVFLALPLASSLASAVADPSSASQPEVSSTETTSASYAGPPATSENSGAAKTSHEGGQTVAVVINPVVFGATDALPKQLSRNHTYTLTAMALVTEPNASGVLTVTSDGAELSDCRTVLEPAGQVTRLRCDLTITTTSTTATLTAEVVGVGSRPAHATYTHTLAT